MQGNSLESRAQQARDFASQAVRNANGNAYLAAQMLAQANPQFAEFMRKSPQQIAQESGIPYEFVMRMLG